MPYLQHVIQLDANFAMGYEAVGSVYFGMSELGRASEYYISCGTMPLKRKDDHRCHLLRNRDGGPGKSRTNATGVECKLPQ